MKSSVLGKLFDYFFIAVGCAVYSVSVVMFIEPSMMSPGGVTGIATVLHFLFNVPSGITVLIINIPLIIIAFVKFGGIFVIKTTYATIMVSVFLTIFENVIPPYQVDNVLSALFGGILMGTGLSLVLMRSATTGGIDIVVKLILNKNSNFSVGKLYLILDVFVLILTSLCYKNFESALYSALCIYVSTKAIDFLIYGSLGGKMLLTVSERPNDVASEIYKAVGHGATLIKAKGSYSNGDKTVIMCAMRRHEASKVISAVRYADSNAFSVICDAGEISGYGFTN